MKKRNVILTVIIVIVVIAIIAIIFIWHTYNAFMKTETVKVDENLTLVLGGGGNSGLLMTDSALVVIDTKMKGAAVELSKLAHQLAGNKKIIVINTHFHSDHTGGNNFYKCSEIYIGNYDTAFLHKNINIEGFPTTFVADSLKLNLGNEVIDLYNLGQGHTMNDVIVYLENRKLLFSGDLIVNKINPVVMKVSGANVDKWIIALTKIINKRGVNGIVPGHGKIGGKELAEAMKSYFEDMKIAAADDSKADAIKKKYASWAIMPIFASPSITIKFIKNSKQ